MGKSWEWWPSAPAPGRVQAPRSCQVVEAGTASCLSPGDEPGRLLPGRQPAPPVWPSIILGRPGPVPLLPPPFLVIPGLPAIRTRCAAEQEF